MKVIKVGDITDKYKEEVDGIIETELIIGGRPLCVKKYIPYFDKINILKSVYITTTEVEDSLLLRHLVLVVELVKLYSNVNLPKNTADAYDLIMATGVYEELWNAVPYNEVNEIQKIIELLDKQEARELEENLSFKAGLQSVIPTVQDTLSLVSQTENMVESLDKDKLEFVSEFMKKASI